MGTQEQHTRAAPGDSGPDVWGLWNGWLRDWFNPGTRNAYFLTEAAAQRMIPLAQRQYARGEWVVRSYPQDVALSGSIRDSPDEEHRRRERAADRTTG